MRGSEKVLKVSEGREHSSVILAVSLSFIGHSSHLVSEE